MSLEICHQKKKAVEAHRLVVETYGENAPVIRTCETCFRQFKSGDIDLTDNEHPGAGKKFEDEELQALLDEDSTQSQQKLAQTLSVTRGAICQRLKSMEKIQKYFFSVTSGLFSAYKGCEIRKKAKFCKRCD